MFNYSSLNLWSKAEFFREKKSWAGSTRSCYWHCHCHCHCPRFFYKWTTTTRGTSYTGSELKAASKEGWGGDQAAIMRAGYKRSCLPAKPENNKVLPAESSKFGRLEGTMAEGIKCVIALQLWITIAFIGSVVSGRNGKSCDQITG